MIRTVFFPTHPVQRLYDDKGRVRSWTREDTLDQYELYLYKNKITRDQIITVQFDKSDTAVAVLGESYYEIMLVYETKD